MGASLCISLCEIPVNTDGVPIWHFSSEFEFVLRQRLDALPEDNRSFLMEQAGMHGVTENFVTNTPEEWEATIEWVLQLVKETDDADDLVARKIEDRWYLLTGGLTHGDDPTDSYQTIYMMEMTNLLKEPFAVNVAGDVD